MSSPRFLLVRLGALGDIVHAIPAAAALRRTFPDARVDWLVSARHEAILALVPVVDRVVAVADRRGAGAGASIPAVVRALRRERYDWAIDLQGLLKSAAFARASGARRVLGFARGALREPLARLLYTEAGDPGSEGVFDPRDTRHVVWINLSLLTRVGVEPGPPAFPIEAADTEVAGEIRRRAGGGYAVLNPGAAWPNKRWPPSRLAVVARALRERHQLTSVVLWGPGERELAEAVVRDAEGAAIATPETSVRDLVPLLRDAALMVSGDTGPGHIAAALGTPIVGIYGPTRPERNGPWRPEDVTVSRAAACECHHLRRCRRERMCLLDIEADEVVAAVERRLGVVERSTDVDDQSHRRLR